MTPTGQLVIDCTKILQLNLTLKMRNYSPVLSRVREGGLNNIV